MTKQRERWTEEEHDKFLKALKLYGRQWRKIEKYIASKTAVQIRSHAQKFFWKLEREASTGDEKALMKMEEIKIPPPRPKRKPNHPYPKKAPPPVPAAANFAQSLFMQHQPSLQNFQVCLLLKWLPATP